MNGRHPIRFLSLPFFHYTKASALFQAYLSGFFDNVQRGQIYDHCGCSHPPLPCCPGTAPKANKGFQQQPACQNPLFLAVSPIFCLFPLYQLSGLHFHVEFITVDSHLFCFPFQDRFLAPDTHALPDVSIIVGESFVKGCEFVFLCLFLHSV